MRAWVIAVVFALALWQPAHAQQLLTPREFGDATVAFLRNAAPDAALERRDTLSITVRRPNAEIPEFTLNLDNAYLEYQRNPDALTEVLDRFTRFAIEPRENAQMRERIVIVLRSRAMIDQFAVQTAALGPTDNPPSQLVWRPFAGDLVEILAFDGAETIQYAMDHMLAELGIAPEEAWAIAPGNLGTRLGQLEIGAVDGADRLAFVTSVNGLTPSMLTDPNFCAAPGLAAQVYMVVDRNGYIMAERSDPLGLRQLRSLHEQLNGSGDAMSAAPVACEGGRLRAFSFTD